MQSSINNQYFIIGGTIKAATSSLYNYLNAHPQVCGSKIKETYFFSQGYTGNLYKGNIWKIFHLSTLFGYKDDIKN